MNYFGVIGSIINFLGSIGLVYSFLSYVILFDNEKDKLIDMGVSKDGQHRYTTERKVGATKIV